MIYNFLGKNILVEPLRLHGQRPWLREINLQLKMRISQTKNQQQNYTKQLLETLRKEKYTHLL